MIRIKEKFKSAIWRLSPSLYHHVAKPYSGQVFSIGICSGASPFELQSQLVGREPILTAADIHDVPAGFVADPFIYTTNGQWVIFFEVFNRANHRGEIGLATSADGQHWQYQNIVLKESHHLAYPQVLADGGNMYLIPDTPEHGVKLYRADQFPLQWRYEQTLLNDPAITDPTVFRHENRWWMISGHRPSALAVRSTRLHFADQLTGPWVEHPASPIVADSLRRSRPAGSVVRYGNRLFRLSQDCSRVYGERIQAHEILELTTTSYREADADDQTLLQAGEAPWYADGMHHASLLEKDNGQWIAAVDGWFMQPSESNVPRKSHVAIGVAISVAVSVAAFLWSSEVVV